jgi:homoserine dehydrogenase
MDVCGYHAGVPFSSVVKNAKDRGFTEPDPREDLSGMCICFLSTIFTHYEFKAEDGIVKGFYQ